MNGTQKTDQLLRDYRRKTSAQAPPELRAGVLAKLAQPLVAHPLGAIISAAGLAAVLSLFITISGIEHREESPPPFFQDSLTNR